MTAEDPSTVLPQTTRRLWRWFQPRLRTKITVPYIILALLLAIGATYFVTRQMTTSLQDQFLTFLRDSGQRAADGVVESERSNLALLRQVAFTSGVAEAVTAGDAEQLRLLVTGNVVNARADVVEVLDLQGRTVLTMYHLPEGGVQDYRFIRGDDRAGLGFVQRVLAGERDELGDKFAGLALDLELAPGSDLDARDVFYVAGPLRREGQLVGAILVGSYLDEMVVRLSRQALAPVTVYGPGGEVLASALTPRVQDAAPLGADLYRDLLTESETRTPFIPMEERTDQLVGGQRYVEAFGPLRVRGRETVGLFSVSLPREAIFQAGSSSALILVTLNSAGLFAILIVGIGLARAITRPILELVGVSSQVARGDLSADVKVGSADEIGVLQRAFQRMIEGLRERDLIREIFGRYVDRDVAEQILAGAVELGGSVKRVTVFFSDIRGFTSMSSQLEPAEVVEFLNDYIAIVVDTVAQFGGVVNKFGGDSTLVIFGAPIEYPDHADRAVKAALEVRRRLAAFNAERQARGQAVIRTGFGINSGDVIAGNIGSRERMEYTVIGDTVNLSSRIQALNKDFPDHEILISEATHRALTRAGAYRVEDLGPVAIRGLEEAVGIYAVVGEDGSGDGKAKPPAGRKKGKRAASAQAAGPRAGPRGRSRAKKK